MRTDNRIYITITGMKIAGQEVRRENGQIILRGAAWIEMDASQTRFNFHAIHLVEPEKPLPIREAALLTDVPMAAMINERFELYLEQLDLDAKKRALDGENADDED